MAELKAETKREEKHIILHKALQRLEMFPDKIETFLDKIRGEEKEPMPEPDDKSRDSITLRSVLNTSPTRIEEVIKRMDGLLSELYSELY